MVPAWFVESWKRGAELLLMEPKKVILSLFAYEFLIDGQRYHLTIGEAWGWTRSL